MTGFLQAFIVISWLLIPLGAAAFLAVYGRPWRYVDRDMAWHLWSATAVAGLEGVALLVAQLSLIPSAIVYGLTTAIIYWRLVLLVKTRRAARRAPPR